MFGTELPHDGEFIVWQLGHFNFDDGDVDASVDMRSGTVLKFEGGIYKAMTTGDTEDEVVGILRHAIQGQGAGATQPGSVMVRGPAEITDEGGRLVYPTGGADAAAKAADKAACLTGLRRLGFVPR